MKKKSLFAVILIFCFVSVSSQSCLPEGITFSMQSQIDNFQIIHPNCTEIEGDVRIGGWDWSDITNLDSLIVINSIGGDLQIGMGNYGGVNPNLTSLTGLKNLTSIGSNLTIASNYVLTSLIGLESLTSIGGSLRIIDNDALESLAGLDNIDEGTIIDIYIYNNNSLSICEVTWLCDYLANPNGSINIYNNASGCDNPAEIADNCGFTIPCMPFGNYYFPSQEDIDNFQADYPGCTELEGDIRISGSDINNLFGLNVINSIGGDLWIYETSFVNLEGFNNITSIGGNLQFTSNYITSLTGLESLDSIHGTLIFGWASPCYGGNPLLTSLTGLETVTYVGGLIINDNNGLTNLSGLYNLTSIGGYLKLNHNDALTSLAGLDSINAASIDDLIIMNNYSLSTCEVQSVCDYLLSLNGEFDIHNNAMGCNSPEEVQDSCIANAVFIDEQYIKDKLELFPNPANQELNISVDRVYHTRCLYLQSHWATDDRC